jgi:heptosyltransferase-1
MMVPSRVLICRLSAIGDCIETWPLVTALKRFSPECEVHWIVDCGVDSLLNEHSAIDHVIRLPKDWLKKPSLLWQIRSQLRSFHFDVAIDPQGLSKSALIAWLSGARRRIGFAPPVSREIAPWLYTETIAPQRTHLVDKQLELLTPLGMRVEFADFGYSPSETSRTWWHQTKVQLGLARSFVAINAGAGWDSRIWDLTRYGEVARYLHTQGVTPLILWGGQRESEMARAIVKHSGGTAKMAPETNLPKLAAILNDSRFYVGSESGPMHLAAALGTLCISLHGPTLPEKSGPYGTQHFPIQREYNPNARKTAGNEALLKITVNDVNERCNQALRRTSGEQQRVA